MVMVIKKLMPRLLSKMLFKISVIDWMILKIWILMLLGQDVNCITQLRCTFIFVPCSFRIKLLPFSVVEVCAMCMLVAATIVELPARYTLDVDLEMLFQLMGIGCLVLFLKVLDVFSNYTFNSRVNTN